MNKERDFMEIREQKLTIAELEKYLGEWINGIMPVKSQENGGRLVEYVVIEPTGCSLVYSCVFNANEYKGEEKTICSTAGIANEELRGLIEQCIALDRQLNESKAIKQSENSGPQNA